MKKKNNMMNRRIWLVALQIKLKLMTISTSSKPKAPTIEILGDSIVKSVDSNIITKSEKHLKHFVVKHFSGAKIADMNHYKKKLHKANH